MPLLTVVSSVVGNGLTLQSPTTFQEGQGSTEQQLSFSGTSNAANPGQITLQYNGVNANVTVPYVAGQHPTATEVENALKTIPESAARRPAPRAM